jgi:hypothetical protein
MWNWGLPKELARRIQRMKTGRIPKQTLEYKPLWQRGPGHPKKRRKDQVHTRTEFDNMQ